MTSEELVEAFNKIKGIKAYYRADLDVLVLNGRFDTKRGPFILCYRWNMNALKFDDNMKSLLLVKHTPEEILALLKKLARQVNGV